MTWEEIEKTAEAVIKAHPDLEPENYAALLDHQLHEHHLLGWLLLEKLGHPTGSDKPERKGG